MQNFACLILLLLSFHGRTISQSVQDGITDHLWYKQRNNCIDNHFNLFGKVYDNRLYSSEKELIELERCDGLEPYCYLFDDDSLWNQLVWRTIKIDTKADSLQWLGKNIKDSFNLGKGIDSAGILDFLKHKSLNGSLTAFQASDFRLIFTEFEIKRDIIPFWDKVVEIRLKEYWNYDKSTGKLNCQIIGLGVVALIRGSRQEICWYYYPEIHFWKNYIGAKNLSNQSDSVFKWKDYLTNHEFNSVLDRWESPEMRESNSYYHSISNRKPHRNDLEALVLLEHMNQIVKYPDSSYSSKTNWTYWSNGFKVQGTLDNGNKTGVWNMYYPSGSVRLTVECENNLPHGKYTSYWLNGKKQEDGWFEHGLREKTWFYWFDSGKLMTRKNLSKGWYSGAQEVWYENGNKHFDYHYSNWKVDGDFSWWYSDGSLMEQGLMRNGEKVGEWKYDIIVPDVLSRIIKNNSLQNDFFPRGLWGFDVSALSDEKLTFTAQHKPELGVAWGEQYGKCLESISEVK